MRLVVCGGGTYQAESVVVGIKEMQCYFMSGCVTTDVICIVWELQVKHLAANKKLYIAFINLL